MCVRMDRLQICKKLGSNQNSYVFWSNSYFLIELQKRNTIAYFIRNDSPQTFSASLPTECPDNRKIAIVESNQWHTSKYFVLITC